MHRRWFRYWLLITGLFLLFLPGTGNGDMGRILTSNTQVREDSQKAIVIHNFDEEILILGTDLASDRKTNILRFIPFPSEPRVSLPQGAPFDRVSGLIKKYNLVFLTMTKGKGGTPSAPVEIRFSSRVGSHDVTVVKIGRMEEFRRWVGEFLASKGFSREIDSSGVEEIASDYVRRGFRYFVFDIVEVQHESHFVEPLLYRFKSKEFYYPLRTSNTFGGKGGIDLIVISPVTLCDPEYNVALYVRGGMEPCLKALGGKSRFQVKASTSAEISMADVKSIYSQAEDFFRDNERVFMQLIRYQGEYLFGEDILVDLSRAPKEEFAMTLENDYLRDDYLLREWQKRSGAAYKKEDSALVLKKDLLKATLSAIEMEIERFEQKLRAAKEGPGDPANMTVFEKRIERLHAEHEKYGKMDPANYVVPNGETVTVKVTGPVKQGSLLELMGMTRSGPFYHVAGGRGGEYRLLKPDKTYRMKIYPVYPRDYPFPSYYVYIENIQ